MISHDFAQGRKCSRCGMDSQDSMGSSCTVAEMEDTEKRMELAVHKLVRFSEWHAAQSGGVMTEIVESYVQKFIALAEITALKEIIVEKLGISHEEMTRKAAESLEMVIGRLQLEMHVIITPDGVLKDDANGKHRT